MSHWERLAVAAIECTGCKETIVRTLRGLDGVRCVTADSLTGSVDVLVDGDVSVGDLESTLQRLGYETNA